MEQLNGLDNMFLCIEQPGLPMTLSTVSIYDPSTAPDGKVRFKDILRTFRNGIPHSSVFRRRIVEVPGGLDLPYWIDDPDFDMEFHVRHLALPNPGDWEQLYHLIERLQARPIERARPLWEAYVIEGLNNLEGVPPGCFAVMLKVHHAVMDGKTGVDTFLAMHDFEPNVPDDGKEAESLLRESRPGRRQLLSNTVKNYGSRLRRAGAIAGNTVNRVRRVEKALREGLIHNIDGKVHTRFNDAPSAYRSVARHRMPVEQCQRLRGLVPGATINDVMLAVIAGAQRRYLSRKNELPRKTLVAGCPVDIRDDGNRNDEHNLVGIMNVALCTDVADPIKRFRRICRESVSAKSYHRSLGADVVNSTTELIPPYLLKWGTKGFLRLADRFPGVQNVLVTNVPGLTVPVYLSGARFVDGFGLGPVLPHCNLFHTVSSTYDHMSISINACRRAMPDPEVYMACMEESWQELLACLEQPRHRVRRIKPTPKKARNVA